MDGKQILAAAEECDANESCDTCAYKNAKCPHWELNTNATMVGYVIAVRDHVKAETIAEIRKWADDVWLLYYPTAIISALRQKLDSMERDKEDTR